MRKLFLCLSILMSAVSLLSAMPKAEVGFGASSLDQVTVGGMQVGQGGFFFRLNQPINQYDFGLTFTNAGNATSAVFGGNVWILNHWDEQKMLKYGPGLWWSSIAGTTAFEIQGQIGVEYNPLRDLGIEGVLVPLRIGFGPSSTALQFLSTRVSLVYYM